MAGPMNVSWLGPVDCECGEKIPGNKNFCAHCGKKKPAKTQQDFSQPIDKTPRKCLECGNLVEYGLQACPKCGTTPGSRMDGAGYICKGCNKQIDRSVQDFSGRNWHKECLTCQECKKAMGTEEFVLIEHKPLCTKCRTEKTKDGDSGKGEMQFCGACFASCSTNFKNCPGCGEEL
eukprot:g50146.t1